MSYYSETDLEFLRVAELCLLERYKEKRLLKVKQGSAVKAFNKARAHLTHVYKEIEVAVKLHREAAELVAKLQMHGVERGRMLGLTESTTP